MSRRQPRVSCIVSLYNKGDAVARPLHSLMAQTMGDWEAIVVDDGSTDHGPEIVRDLVKRDPRITMVSRANGGVSSARNLGLEMARGEFVHFLDADDPLQVNAYTSLLESARDDVHGAVGAYDICSADGRRLGTQCRAREIVDLDDLIERGTIWTCAHILRREAIGPVRFRRRFEPFEDADMWFNLAERGVRWRYIRERVAMYMIHPGSASKQALRYLTLTEECLIELFDRQRALGDQRRLSDVSEERLATLLGESALRYATRAVVQGGPESLPQVAECYIRARGSKSLSARTAAEMGRSAVIHGLGELPAMNRQPVPGWAAALDQWWRLLESRGWGEPGLSEGAWFVMRTLRVPPAKVCEALLERVGSVSEVTLVGFGQNGRLLAEQAIGRGLRVYVRDDRYPDGLLPEPVARMGVIGEPIDAPATRPVVITPLDDSRLTPRFAECKPLRWHEMLMELARMSWSSETLEAELHEQAESRCPGPWPASAPWPENMVAASARV